MATKDDGRKRLSAARQVGVIAEKAATFDQCVEGVIARLAEADNALADLATDGLPRETADQLAAIHTDIVMAAMALRGARTNSSPTEALLSIVNQISPNGGDA